MLRAQVDFLQSVVDNHRKNVNGEMMPDESLTRLMNELAQLRGTIEKLRSTPIDSGGEKSIEKEVHSMDRQMRYMVQEIVGLIDTIQRVLKLGKYSDLARALL